MEGMHLLGLARAQGYYDILRVDAAGQLAESTTSNLFFILEGCLHTPSLDTGILPGVIRAALLRDSKLEVVAGRYAPELLLDAEAVWVTNATNGLQVIEGIDGFAGQQTVNYVGACELLDAAKSVLVRAQAARAYQLI
jgi:branched-subunit amino acid aminotransferase/4-amino-4-deoxychorismate lyase